MHHDQTRFFVRLSKSFISLSLWFSINAKWNTPWTMWKWYKINNNISVTPASFPKNTPGDSRRKLFMYYYSCIMPPILFLTYSDWLKIYGWIKGKKWSKDDVTLWFWRQLSPINFQKINNGSICTIWCSIITLVTWLYFSGHVTIKVHRSLLDSNTFLVVFFFNMNTLITN